MLKKFIKTLKLMSPICFHDFERTMFTRKCSKCNKEITGSGIVVKHGDWIFSKRGD